MVAIVQVHDYWVETEFRPALLKQRITLILPQYKHGIISLRLLRNKFWKSLPQLLYKMCGCTADLLPYRSQRIGCDTVLHTLRTFKNSGFWVRTPLNSCIVMLGNKSTSLRLSALSSGICAMTIVLQLQLPCWGCALWSTCSGKGYMALRSASVISHFFSPAPVFLWWGNFSLGCPQALLVDDFLGTSDLFF